MEEEGEKSSGFFANLFSSKKKQAPQPLQIGKKKAVPKVEK